MNGPEVEVRLIEGPVPPLHVTSAPGAGSLLAFAGVVRPQEQERELSALMYEVYEPMTTRKLVELAKSVAERYDLLVIRVEHSFGRVPVGCVSFRLLVASEHRKESLAAVGEFIDVMKRDVPIWKLPEWTAR